MLFQQSNDMEFAGAFYYFVVAPLAIALRNVCTQCLCVCVCLLSVLDWPVIVIVSAGGVRTNKQSLVQKSCAYFFVRSPRLISQGCCAQQLAPQDTVLHTSWRVPTGSGSCFDKVMICV